MSLYISYSHFFQIDDVLIIYVINNNPKYTGNVTINI